MRARLLAAYDGEYRDHVAALRTSLAQGAAADWEEAFRHAHSLKGAARAVDLPAVVALAHELETRLDAWHEGGQGDDPAALAAMAAAVDAIEDLSAAAMPAPSAERTDPAAATIRVEAATATRLAAATAQLLAELDRRRRVSEDVLRRLAAQAPPSLRPVLAETARTLEERDWDLSRAARAVAGDVARLRLVAAEAVMGHFGPMLRALAVESGKDVRFDAYGLSTLADREVLSTLAEAVLHLLRNAVAHGIEAPAARHAAGKAATGRVELTVARVGRHLEVAVADDGAGLNVAALAQAAVAHGLMSADQAHAAAPDRLAQLVFHPGLSTAGAVDATAGRGMGMAIVRRLVDRLQGDVVIRSRRGQGTRAVMSVPVTLLSQRVALVRTGGAVYALPAAALVRVSQVPPEALAPVAGGMVARLDGEEVALLDLGVTMGHGAAGPRPNGLCVVVTRMGADMLGLVVDGVDDVSDLPVTPLEPELVDDARLVGTVMLDGGELALVLSPAGLRAVAPMATPRLAVSPKPVPLVLVVDDSATIRALERSVLEAHSYRVETVPDGRAALDLMERVHPDVVVSDIEMPRLDGFGLLAAMRADPRLASIPVMLVSSRAGAADVRRGQELGAVAHLAKGRFDQRAFLDVVRRWTT